MTTLSVIRSEVRKFRSENPNPQSPLPPAIKAAVMELCKTHSMAHVARSTNIPATTLYGWKKKSQSKAPRKDPAKPLWQPQTTITPTAIVPLGTVGSLVRLAQGGGKYEVEVEGKRSMPIKFRFDKNDSYAIELFFRSMMSAL